MFKPGQSGNPKGRPKGAKDYRHDFYDVMTKLQKMDHDPIEAMIIMAKDESLDPKIRLKANSELLARVAPVLKAIDHTVGVKDEPEEIQELKKRALEKLQEFKMDH